MFNRDLGIVKWCRLCDRVSMHVGGVILIMFVFRILLKVIACLIIRRRSSFANLVVALG